MRNRLSKTLPIAVALLLALGGAAYAEVNAGATFAIDTPREVSGIGANTPVSVTISAAGLVGVKQLEVIFQVSPADAFVVSKDVATFTLGGGFAAALSPGVEVPQSDQIKGGGALVAGSGVSGTSVLGTLSITTSPTFTSNTRATITVVKIGVGPTSTRKDFFQPPSPAMVVTINPPAPAPTVGSIAPTSGLQAGGTAVTITGTDFVTGATVTIGGQAATSVVVVSGTSITAVTPGPASLGAADVVVANADLQSATLALGYTYVRPPAPSVVSVSPNRGVNGGSTAITITGANFVAPATVTVGGIAATAVTVVSATSITATTPAGAEGGADVVVTNADAQSGTLAGGFTYFGIIDAVLNASTARDLTKYYSAIGEAQSINASAGEAVFSVRFNGNTGAATAGQSIGWAITNNGSESVYRLGAGAAAEIVPGATLAATTTTGVGGIATITLDAEGGKTAGTTSVTVVATTSTTNSVGTPQSLRVAFAATWDVPVAAELSSFAGTVEAGSHVRLQWTAASQTGNLGWQVYRSSDNVTFVPVGEMVAGDGTVDQALTYEFVDASAPVSGAVFYFLSQVNLDGRATASPVIEVVVSPTAVASQALPMATALRQNFPNPFNPETTISFELSQPSVVAVTVYDATGQLVRTLVWGETYQAGRYATAWNGRDNGGVKVGSGVYLYQLQTGDGTLLRRMTLIQ